MSFGQTRRSPSVARSARPVSRWVRLLLLLPIVAVFGVPGHETADLLLLGVSFSYWYQALWIVISAGLVYTVYRLEN